MKKTYLLLPFLLVISHLNGQTVNPVFIGSCDDDMLSEMVLHNKYIYGIGSTNSFGASSGDIYLFKADTAGHGIWARLVTTGDDADNGTTISISNSNQITVSCQVPGSAMIMRFDTSGNLLQSFSFNDTGTSLICNSAKDGDGAVLSGIQVMPGSFYPLVVSLDSAGNVEWSKNLQISGPGPTAGDGLATSSLVLSDGSIMVTGTVFLDTAAAPFVAKLNAAGGLVWGKVYNMKCFDGNGNIIQTSDGNYMVCGSVPRADAPGADPFTLKIDPTGDPIYSYVYRIDYSTGSAVSMTRVRIAQHDGNFLLTGSIGTTISGTASDYYTLCLDPLGTVNWAKRYGNSTLNICNSAIMTTGYFILGGYSTENTAGNAIVGYEQGDIMLLKTAYDGSSAVNSADIIMSQEAYINNTTVSSFSLVDYPFTLSGITVGITNVETTYDSVSCFGLQVLALENKENGISIYPNPAVAYTEVVVQNIMPSFDLYVHNATGELVLSRTNILTGKTLVDVNALSPGIYHVTVRSGHQLVGTQKLVVN